MIFLNKKYKKPEVGETKIVTRFAWLPVRMDDKTIWLEKYDTIYIFQELSAFVSDDKVLKYRLWTSVSKRLWIK